MSANYAKPMCLVLSVEKLFFSTESCMTRSEFLKSIEYRKMWMQSDCSYILNFADCNFT